MPIQVDGAFLRAPCPVPSYPAYEPNPGSVFPSLSTKAYSSRGADIVMQSSGFHVCFPGSRLEFQPLEGIRYAKREKSKESEIPRRKPTQQLAISTVLAIDCKQRR
jgi:hypothetical protein